MGMFLPDFPNWWAYGGCLMAIIGVLAVIAGAVMGVVWLFNHIQFI